MTFTSWVQWLKGTPGREGYVQHPRPHRRTVTPRRSFVPRLDVLEDRTVPSGLQNVLNVVGQGSLSDRTEHAVKRFDAATGAFLGTLAARGRGDLNSPRALVVRKAGNDNRAPDLGDCQNLQVPAGHKVAFHAYAKGVQIYRWDGTSWTFVAPEAGLFADAGYNGAVGSHYAGPTWESNSGSKVVGMVLERCTPNPAAIDWLKLKAVSNQGPGLFHRVTFIQRVNTVGGKAPTHSGNTPGEVARVPYTAEYFFYRAHP
jgi:hypothetical protein